MPTHVATLIALFLLLLSVGAARAQDASTPAPPIGGGAPLFESPIVHGAWLWEGNCLRCHGAYEDERVGRYVGEDFDDKELGDRIAGISREGCTVDWAISRGGSLRLEEIKAIVAYVLAWEADPGALELGVLPPQPTATPTPAPTTAADAAPTPSPTATIPPAIAAILPQDPLYEGAWLYAEQCVTCHGDYGRARQGSMLTMDEVGTIVRKGKLGSSMPAFAISSGGRLFGREIDAILTYIGAWETQGRAPDLPAPLQDHLDARIAVAVPIVTPTPLPPTPGPAARGLVVFEARCAQCHGSEGDGEAGVGPALSRLPLSHMQTLIRETVEGGRAGTIMRAWHGEAGGPLDDEEVDDLLALLAEWTLLPTATPVPSVAAEGASAATFWLLLGMMGTVGILLLGMAYIGTAIVPPKAGPDIDEE
jgi:mono/diheme cytochrome c family protein